jgi:adenosylcobinamide-GDP ribazoletransferase
MAFLEAVRFLTVLPVSFGQAPSEMAAEGDAPMARSIIYFPWVGAMLGVLVALIDWGLHYLLPAQVASAVVLVAWMGLTGGLHLDGLADTADGLLGGWDRERRLAIMKDSRLGSFGALALFAALLLKFSLLGHLPWGGRVQALVLAPVLARWAMVQAIVCYPPARQEGLGHFFRQHAKASDLALASILPLALSVACYSLWGLAVFGGVSLLALLVDGAVMRSVGGLTGDTYGALCEIEEICVLALVLALGGGGLL